jgi:hypothetical protein
LDHALNVVTFGFFYDIKMYRLAAENVGIDLVAELSGEGEEG